MLGSMAGLWLSMLFFILLLIGAVGMLVGSAMGKPTAPSYERGILCIKLEGVIPERQGEQSIEDLVLGGMTESETFTDIVTSIRLAAADKKIVGIFIDCPGSELGLASRSEIVEALKKFKDTNKFVYAYADNYEQGDYYIASVADSIFVNPVGMINVHGLATTTIFYKNLLDKLGVQVQVVKVGAYKSAVEPYILTSMSAPSREQNSIFLNQIWDKISKDISESRSVAQRDVNVWADSLSMTWAPEQYVMRGMATSLKYRSDVEKMLLGKVGLDEDDELPFVTASEYMEAHQDKLGRMGKPHIAVLYAVGEITESGSTGIASSRLVPEIEDLARDEDVKGMVLRVNSPGGSAFASEQIWHALQQFKATGKLMYVSMGDYAASGGYYISCGADKIYADEATLTGSIGIFGLIPNGEGLLHGKLGLNFEMVETNPNANFPSLVRPMTAQQYAAMQGYVERGYETFVSRVAQGRDMPVDSVKAIGGGRVWDGMSALGNGLVDEIGSLSTAVQALAEALDVKADDYVCYPQTPASWYERLIADQLEIKVNVPGLDAAQAKQCLDAVQAIKEMDPLQARMETMIMK